MPKPLYPQKLIPTQRNQYLHQYPWEISIGGQTTKKKKKKSLRSVKSTLEAPTPENS